MKKINLAPTRPLAGISKISGSGLTVAFVAWVLVGCAHTLPQRDLKPELARADGYFVSHDEAKARGGVGAYVSQICSTGYWGMPDPACKAEKAPIKQTVAHQPTRADRIALQQASAVPAKSTPKELSIYFETAQADLPAGVANRIQTLVTAMPEAQRKTAIIRVFGYADSRGSALKNRQLSEKRAQEVALALIAAGISESQIHVSGKGAIQSTGSGHKATEARKVELRIN